MQKLRKYIKNTPFLWVACVLPALLFMLSMQLHLHVHADHQHGSDVQQHSHETNLHTTHLGNTHDAQHGFDQHHAEVNTFAVDISPEGLNKSFTLMLLVCALISAIVLLLSPQAQRVVLQHRDKKLPHIRRHGAALPPQLRAPPL